MDKKITCVDNERYLILKHPTERDWSNVHVTNEDEWPFKNVTGNNSHPLPVGIYNNMYKL